MDIHRFGDDVAFVLEVLGQKGGEGGGVATGEGFEDGGVFVHGGLPSVGAEAVGEIAGAGDAPG